MFRIFLILIIIIPLYLASSLSAESLEFIDNKYWSFTTDAAFSSDTSIFVTFKTGITEMVLGINEQLFIDKELFLEGNVLALEKIGDVLYVLTRYEGLFIIKNGKEGFDTVGKIEVPRESYIMSACESNIVVGNKNKLYLFRINSASELALIDSLHFIQAITYAEFNSRKLFITLADTIMKQFNLTEGEVLESGIEYKVPLNPEFFAIQNNNLFISNIIDGLNYFELTQNASEFKCKVSTPEKFFSSLAIASDFIALSLLDQGVEVYETDKICGGEPLFYYENMKNSQKVIFDASKLGLVNNEMGFEFLRFDVRKGLLQAGEFIPETSILDAEVIDNYVVVAAGRYGMPILETTSKGVREVSIYQPGGYVRDIYIHENKAYITVEGVGISVVSLENTEHPGLEYNLDYENPFAVASNGEVIAFSAHGSDQIRFAKASSMHYLEGNEYTQDFDIEGFAREILIMGDYCYASCDRGGLYIFDISNPDVIAYARRYKTAGYTRGLAIEDSTLYLACGEAGVAVLNIANPMRIKEVANIKILLASDVSVSGNYLAASSDNEGCFLYDISNKSEPVFLAKYQNSGLASKISIQNQLVFMVDQYSIYILKISP
ncbi:hypothetical protein JXI42_12300 [bacterium]|nr:hypothetical protein [bacterium]